MRSKVEIENRARQEARYAAALKKRAPSRVGGSGAKPKKEAKVSEVPASVSEVEDDIVFPAEIHGQAAEGAVVERVGAREGVQFSPVSFSLAAEDLAFLRDEQHRRRLRSLSETIREILRDARQK